MPTLIPTLSLTSDAATSDTLDFTVIDSLSIKAPNSNISTVIATATANETIIVPASTAIAYLYVKHTGTTDGSTATSQLVDVEETGNAAFARLGPGEFLFMPFCHHEGNVGVQLHVQHASVVQMEYAYWTKA